MKKLCKFIENNNFQILKVLVSYIISSFLTIYIIGQLRKKEDWLKLNAEIISNKNINVTSIEYIMVIFALLSIFFIPVIMGFLKDDKFNGKALVGVVVSIIGFVVGISFIGRPIINDYIVFLLFLFIICWIYILINFIIIIYKWLWETSYIKGNKVKKKYKKIDTKKLSLLWAIIIFILGILFNFKK